MVSNGRERRAVLRRIKGLWLVKRRLYSGGVAIVDVKAGMADILLEVGDLA